MSIIISYSINANKVGHMCDWWYERIKPEACKAIPPHITEKKEWKYCSNSPQHGTSCGTEKELSSSRLTITEKGRECSQCKGLA
jgi:hypothetical protein